MSPLPLIVLLGLGAYALSSKKSSAGNSQASKAPSEVPADANSLLATMLAPSLTDVNTLAQIYKTFAAAIQNQTNGNAKLRLAQYALATFLKLASLSKGAQPDPNELLMIAYAPTAGGKGLVGYGDAAVDRQTAIVNAINTASDVGSLGQYIQAFATAYNTAKPGPERKRLLAYILAAKTKQLAVKNGGYTFPAESYFAIANIRADDLPTTTNPNSILAI